MTTRYRRNPWLVMEWSDDNRVVVVDSRSQRKFRVEPSLLRLLNQMSTPTEPDDLHVPEYTPEKLASLLNRMAKFGMIQPVNGRNEADQVEWTASELAVHAQASRGGKVKVRLQDIPPARLHHREALKTIPLLTSNQKSQALADVLRTRRSIRDFDPAPLTFQQLSSFLDMAARVRGWLGPDSWQTTRRPSASGGARHSIELYLIVRNVGRLDPGAYHYDPFDHSLDHLQPWTPELAELQRKLVCRPMLVNTPPHVSFYLASYYRRVQCKYGAMTLSIIYRDTGCLLQTLYLVATDLGLAPCATAAIEADPSPSFLHDHRSDFIHTANFALGLPAHTEPTGPEFRPLEENKSGTLPSMSCDL
jgi:SagB-type dehydrogenase family enzyme